MRLVDDLVNFKKNQKEIFFDILKVLSALMLIILLGVYIGNLLFGKNSVEVLFELQNKKEALKREVQRLKEENAKLQKEYFELKQLEPE
ncbi:FtsB family cell division protein [Nitrosophilus kaiyonis]|uniref:FtsB family cell division protein n=1 Tax=Nitrosophilus kaiyonis TaxID=2930200 RepID=UPI002491E610|nr:septum formation initiator family protein [Nitrosophilus kaiyonis]